MSEETKATIDARLRAKYPDIFNPAQKSEKIKPKTVAAICLDCKKPYTKNTFVIGMDMATGKKIEREYSGGRCPECRQKRWEIEKVKIEKQRQAAIEAQKLKWWKTSGVPFDYLDKSFQNFEKNLQPKAYADCLNFAENYPVDNPHGYRSIVLFGDKSWGTGKTHLGCAICRRIIQRWTGKGTDWDYTTNQLTQVGRNPVYFISEPDMFSRIRSTYDYTLEEKQRKPTEASIMNGLVTVPLLVIDDMGKQLVSDPKFVQRTLFTIIDTRYRTGLPMVITANLDPDMLRHHLGGGVENDASFSRLKAMVKGKFVNVPGEDYRQRSYKKG